MLMLSGNLGFMLFFACENLGFMIEFSGGLGFCYSFLHVQGLCHGVQRVGVRLGGVMVPGRN